MGKVLVVGPVQTRECNMTAEIELNQPSHLLPLKNGTQADVRQALVEYYSLLALLDSQPHHFHALLAIAQNRPEEATQESREYLRARGSLADDGAILSLTRDV